MSDFSQKNMEIIERIQQIIDHENLNISSFAKKIGVVDQTIRGIVTLIPQHFSLTIFISS